MNKHLKRLTAFLLALVMVLSTGIVSSLSALTESKEPLHVYTEEEYKAIDDDVFALIGSVKEDALMRKTYTEGASAYLTEEDYIGLVPDVIKAIEASDTYLEGTLQQNGYFLVWQTKSGIPCCYDPRMEAKLSKPSSATDEEIQAIEQDVLDWAKELESSVSELNATGHVPTSTKIGLIQPYWESNSNYDDATFRSYSPYYKTMWQSLYGATGGTGLRYSMNNATVDNIATTLEQCAIVIFDSHGTTDYTGYDYSNGVYDYTSRANSSYLCLITSSGITSADTQPQSGTFGTYYNCMKGSDYAYVNGTCIANHMSSNAPGSLLYMGICLGMATDKMFTGLRNKGVEVVYGYSQSVSFDGELDYMQSILGYVKNGDNFSSAVSKSKAALGDWDPAYSDLSISQAIKEKVAFPITVSTEDIYPGHGNVDAVQEVYSTWTLFTTYTVTATSNNNNYGTVSVNGYTITASPKDGYYAAGYTVTKGTASVEQNGNVFTVEPSTDCTVRINFAQKTPVTVTCFTEGSEYQTLTGYAYEPITLPASAPSVEGWSFMGWTTEEIGESETKPSYFNPGQAITASSNTSLYAVYRAVNQEVPAVKVYDLVTETPSDLSGEYVITNTASAASILKGLSGSNKTYESANAGGCSTLEAAGITLSDSSLHNVDDVYVFTIEPNDSYYTIRNNSTGTYVASVSDSLRAYGNLNASYCNWTLIKNGAGFTLKNNASSRYPYLSYSNSGYFAVNASANSVVYLWKSSFENYIYSTGPSSLIPPEVKYTVSFSLPDGVNEIKSQTVDKGNSITLPVAEAPEGYSFLGWVEDVYNNVTAAPSSVLSGSYTPSADITLNALYSCTVENEDGYELLTSAPSEWTGNFVITYGNDNGLYILKSLPKSNAVKALGPVGFDLLSDTELDLTANLLSNVGSEYVLTAAASGSGITLKNNATGTYLASRNDRLCAYPSLSAKYCTWTPSLNASVLGLENAASSDYPYLSFTAEDHFILSDTSDENLRIWKITSSTIYTTVIE